MMSRLERTWHGGDTTTSFCTRWTMHRMPSTSFSTLLLCIFIRRNSLSWHKIFTNQNVRRLNLFIALESSSNFGWHTQPPKIHFEINLLSSQSEPLGHLCGVITTTTGRIMRVVDLHKLQRQKHNAQHHWLHITKTLTYSTNEKWWMLYETIGSRKLWHNGKLDTRISHCVIAVGFVIVNAHTGCPVFNSRAYIMLHNKDGKISRSHSIIDGIDERIATNAGQLKCVSFRTWNENKRCCRRYET